MEHARNVSDELNDFVQKHGRPMGWNPQSPTIESFIEQYGWEMKPNRGYGRNQPTTNSRRNTIVLRRMR